VSDVSSTTNDVCRDESSVPVQVVRSSLETLNEAGLVSPVDDGRVAAAVRPGPGLDMLVRRKEAELRQARITAVDAYESFLRCIGGEPVGHLIEVIGGAAVHERIRQLERGAHDEIRGFDSPPYYADADANQIELDNLGRGVRYQVVYATAAVERADYLTAASAVRLPRPVNVDHPPAGQAPALPRACRRPQNSRLESWLVGTPSIHTSCAPRWPRCCRGWRVRPTDRNGPCWPGRCG
jgi:hypothetical protein